MLTMKPHQSRMARAGLNWSIDDLAKASGVGRATVARFELGQTIQTDRLQAMRSALEAAGIQFFDSGKIDGALRLRELG